jgi:hypothetical protein
MPPDEMGPFDETSGRDYTYAGGYFGHRTDIVEADLKVRLSVRLY